MLHPTLKTKIKLLNTEWLDCMKEAREATEAKMAERGPQYEQMTPVWFRVTPGDLMTMIKIKSDRIQSEFVRCNGDLTKWDPDNAIDLIVYTLFLVAYYFFLRGANNEQK